jgi:hypothetical protein
MKTKTEPAAQRHPCVHCFESNERGERRETNDERHRATATKEDQRERERERERAINDKARRGI